MACACGKNKTTQSSSTTYLVTTPNGERKPYKTEVEAAAAAKRTGGTYRRQ
jgi:hypothetical protein